MYILVSHHDRGDDKENMYMEQMCVQFIVDKR